MSESTTNCNKFRKKDNGATAKTVTKKTSMVWYKILIYFFLYFTALYNLLQAAGYFLGKTVVDSKIVEFDVGIIEIVNGIFCITFACFAIYVRQRLAKHKSNGPTMLAFMYFYSIAYGITVNLILNDTNTFFNYIVSALLELLFIKINSVYFKKREDLFFEY